MSGGAVVKSIVLYLDKISVLMEDFALRTFGFKDIPSDFIELFAKQIKRENCHERF